MDANCEASIRRYITFTDPDQVVVDYLADHNSYVYSSCCLYFHIGIIAEYKAEYHRLNEC